MDAIGLATGSPKGDITPLLDSSLAALAREIAMDIQDVSTILASHGMDAMDLERLKQDPVFGRLLQAAVSEWNSAFSTAERIRLKAQAMVEESLPSLHEASIDTKIPLAQRVEALKFSAKLGALLDERNAVVGSKGGGGGFAVTINIGSDSVKITQAPEVIDVDGE